MSNLRGEENWGKTNLKFWFSTLFIFFDKRSSLHMWNDNITLKKRYLRSIYMYRQPRHYARSAAVINNNSTLNYQIQILLRREKISRFFSFLNPTIPFYRIFSTISFFLFNLAVNPLKWNTYELSDNICEMITQEDRVRQIQSGFLIFVEFCSSSRI